MPLRWFRWWEPAVRRPGSLAREPQQRSPCIPQRTAKLGVGSSLNRQTITSCGQVKVRIRLGHCAVTKRNAQRTMALAGRVDFRFGLSRHLHWRRQSMRRALGTEYRRRSKYAQAHEEIQVPQRPAGNNVGRMMHVQRHPGNTDRQHAQRAHRDGDVPSKPAVQHGQQDG